MKQRLPLPRRPRRVTVRRSTHTAPRISLHPTKSPIPNTSTQSNRIQTHNSTLFRGASTGSDAGVGLILSGGAGGMATRGSVAMAATTGLAAQTPMGGAMGRSTRSGRVRGGALMRRFVFVYGSFTNTLLPSIYIYTPPQQRPPPSRANSHDEVRPPPPHDARHPRPALRRVHYVGEWLPTTGAPGRHRGRQQRRYVPTYVWLWIYWVDRGGCQGYARQTSPPLPHTRTPPFHTTPTQTEDAPGSGSVCPGTVARAALGKGKESPTFVLEVPTAGGECKLRVFGGLL